MNKIAKAQAVLADLNAQREKLIARSHELEERRQAIAFEAHTGNKAQRTKLDEINNEALTQEYEVKSLDSAIAEATRRLAAADQAAALAQDKENAQALRAVVDKFVAQAIAIDASFAAMVTSANALEEALKEVHLLGCPFPSRGQLDALGARAMKTALMKTPWTREFEHLAPSERTSFTQLVETWSERIEANFISPKIGALKVEELA
jgi:hypothetical protein